MIWNNKIDKSSGYTIENGQSTYETENIPINIGGRPKKSLNDYGKKLHHSNSFNHGWVVLKGLQGIVSILVRYSGIIQRLLV